MKTRRWMQLKLAAILCAAAIAASSIVLSCGTSPGAQEGVTKHPIVEAKHAR